MKQYTNTLKAADPKKHSIVFKPAGDDANVIASSIYILNDVIPDGADECKITISWPDGGQDEEYNNL
jgi:hypothetical protein